MWPGGCLTSHHQILGLADSRPLERSIPGETLAAVAAPVAFRHPREADLPVFIGSLLGFNLALPVEETGGTGVRDGATESHGSSCSHVTPRQDGEDRSGETELCGKRRGYEKARVVPEGPRISMTPPLGSGRAEDGPHLSEPGKRGKPLPMMRMGKPNGYMGPSLPVWCLSPRGGVMACPSPCTVTSRVSLRASTVSPSR